MPSLNPSQSCHATVVSVSDTGLLITGPSGAGKSRLAAHMVALGAELVVDDLVVLRAADGKLWAEAPPNAVAKIALSGLGLVPIALRHGAVCICAELTLKSDVTLERLPDLLQTTHLDCTIPHLKMPFSEDLAPLIYIWLRAFKAE